MANRFIGTKVRIKLKNPTEKPTMDKRKRVMNVLETNRIYCTRYIDIADGWIVVPSSQKDVENLIGIKVERLLNPLGVQVVLPGEVLAQFSLVLKNLDNFVFQHNEQEIKR
ncbi:MAG: hypothetical protein AAGJ80_18815, partial [Cyanobacteria bacterium J06553_1]